MKNALWSGIIIGILSGLWLFIMHWAGYDTHADKVSPIEYISILIPLIGLFLGLKSYRDDVLGGRMSFIVGIVQCLKTLFVAGAIAVFLAVVYINYIASGSNLLDFSGRLFGAFLLGILFSFLATLALMTKGKNSETM